MKKFKIHPFNPSEWAVSKVVNDLVNYHAWVKTIDKEKANSKSLWYKFGMKHNFFYIIYFHMSLPQEDQALPDNIKRMRVVESLAPIHRYLDEDLLFSEYIVPEFNQFYDDENKPTLAYGIIYRFAFKRLSLYWAISRAVITTGLIWAFIHYPIISTFIQWFQNLI